MEQGELVYQIRQCSACHFRFPALSDMPPQCPLCQAPTAVVALPSNSHKQKTAVDHPVSTVHLELLLDNIRSLHNVGAIFRSADGAGIRHIHLCGMSGTPAHPKLAKTALGAHEHVPWSYSKNGLDTAVALQQQGYRLWALEETPAAQSLFQAERIHDDGRPIVLVVGNENVGVDPAILALCEQVVALPMQGIKDSLNVSVALGIAVYTIRFGGSHA